MTETIEVPKKKPFWKSKSVWFNGITALLAAAEYLTPLNIVSAPVMLGISTAGNLILRTFFADQKLSVSK